ncbi:MAG: medium chain dehydrogenase/reductase family protein, partial [Bacteroidota bacterium]
PEVLQVHEEAELPVPAAGEVRVKVLATSAAFTDTMIRKGVYPGTRGKKPPFSPGYDFVGVVDELGEGVTKFKVGQMVAELSVTGAYAQYLCWHEDHLVPVPKGLDPSEAVSMILTYITAYQMLHRYAKIQKGQRILIHGAGGAMGTALLELGRLLDLEMYGTDAGGKLQVISDLGGTPIDYRTEDVKQRVLELTGDGVDAVFDGVGASHNIRLLRKGGKLVIFGLASVDMESLKAKLGFGLKAASMFIKSFFSRKKSAAFYSIAPLRKKHADWFHKDLSKLLHLLAEGRLKPIIEERLPLKDAVKAHERIEKGGIKGKLVLLPHLE